MQVLGIPPAGSKNVDVKDMNAKIVWGVIQGIGDGEIDNVVEKLSMEVSWVICAVIAM